MRMAVSADALAARLPESALVFPREKRPNSSIRARDANKRVANAARAETASLQKLRQLDVAALLADRRNPVEFRLDTALPILERTPGVMRTLLSGLSTEWIDATEGHGTWSPFDVVGHLIHGERTDWMPRVEHLFQHGDAVAFPAFDREAMFEASKGRTLDELLHTFKTLRTKSVDRLAALNLTEADLERRGRHPEFGVVTLRQHLSTWVAHDLGHIGQVVRVMARQYSDAVGPWRAYLSILAPRGHSV
jgi:hypothetical protein